MNNRLRTASFLKLLAALAWLAGCAVNPVTGKREISLMSPAQEAAIGAQAAQQVEAEMGLVEDPALASYVKTLGQRLAVHSPRQDVSYRFHVADMADPNAFALPGGYIYVSRGLLALFNSEAELANVLGHEIAHVAARHAAQRQTRATGVGVLSVLATIVTGAKAGGQAAQAVQQAGQALGAGYIASYGRDQERQSDEIGQKMSAQAGWDPAAMSSFLATLEADTRLRSGGQERQVTYLDSHPALGERVQTTLARAAELPTADVPPVAGSRAAFYRRVAGIRIGPDPAQGIFDGQRFLHPDMDFTLVMPDGWLTRNQPDAVLSAPKERDALIRLELAGDASDPEAAAREFMGANSIEFRGGRGGKINGLPAWQGVGVARAEQGEMGLSLTFVRHPRAMFRIVGLAPVSRFDTHAQAFANAAGSFRGLTRAERSGISDYRLAVAEARAGETIESFNRRTGNQWSVEQTAVANGLTSSRFTRARPVKIVRRTPY